jgi:hypothetical protein
MLCGNGVMSERLDAVDDALSNAASEPLKMAVDGRSAEQRTVDELLKLRAHEATQVAQTNKVAGFGLRFQKIQPPGCG